MAKTSTTEKKKKGERDARLDELHELLNDIKAEIDGLRGDAAADDTEAEDFQPGEAPDLDEIDFDDDADGSEAEALINKVFADAAAGGDFKPLKGEEREEEEEKQNDRSADPLRRRGRREAIEVGAGRRAARGAGQQKGTR